MTNVSLQMLETKHERQLEIGVLSEQFGSRYDGPSVGKQCTVKINSMKCTHLNEPCNVVCVFHRYDSKGKNNDGFVESMGTKTNDCSIVLRTGVVI